MAFPPAFRIRVRVRVDFLTLTLTLTLTKSPDSILQILSVIWTCHAMHAPKLQVCLYMFECVCVRVYMRACQCMCVRAHTRVNTREYKSSFF